jgi:hypothetical protein
MKDVTLEFCQIFKGVVMKFRTLTTLLAAVLLAACSSKTPNCSADETKKLLSQALGNKFQEMGISATNVENLITISDVQVVKKDEKLDKYSCQANFSITKPAGLGEKIYNIVIANNGKGLDDFGNTLIKKYGDVPGGTLSGSLNGMISGGLGLQSFALIISDTAPQNEKLPAFENLKKMLAEATSPYPIPVAYEVFSVENDGKSRPSLTWTANDDGNFELNVMLFKVNEALK